MNITTLTIKDNNLTIKYSKTNPPAPAPSPTPSTDIDCNSCKLINSSTKSLYTIPDGNLTSEEIYYQYIEHYNSYILLQSQDGENILKKIEEYMSYNSPIPSPPTLLQLTVKDNLGHFGIDSSQSLEMDDNPLYGESLNSDWLLKNNNIIDWTDKKNNWAGAEFTCINQQGVCGDCWANAATECITIRLSIQTGYYCPLDINQLIQCDSANAGYGTFDSGCHGGQPYSAMTYISKNPISGPRCNNKKYPSDTTECTNGVCTEDVEYSVTCENVGEVTGWTYTWENYKNIMDKTQKITEDEKNSLIKELSNGPIAINIWSSGSIYSAYKGGVYNWVKDVNSYSKEIGVDHAVLLTGYFKCPQSDGSINEYWVIQNSWDIHHGIHGFTYVAAKDGNNDFDDGENIAYPISSPVFCTPKFDKCPIYDKSYYQKECCPVCDIEFVENMSCTALTSNTPYNTAPTFPTSGPKQNCTNNTAEQPCKKHPVDPTIPRLNSTSVLTDYQNAYKDNSITESTLLPPYVTTPVILVYSEDKSYKIASASMTYTFLTTHFFGQPLTTNMLYHFEEV